jgi:hypothetical protein
MFAPTLSLHSRSTEKPLSSPNPALSQGGGSNSGKVGRSMDDLMNDNVFLRTRMAHPSHSNIQPLRNEKSPSSSNSSSSPLVEQQVRVFNHLSMNEFCKQTHVFEESIQESAPKHSSFFFIVLTATKAPTRNRVTSSSIGLHGHGVQPCSFG